MCFCSFIKKGPILQREKEREGEREKKKKKGGLMGWGMSRSHDDDDCIMVEENNDVNVHKGIKEHLKET